MMHLIKANQRVGDVFYCVSRAVFDETFGEQCPVLLCCRACSSSLLFCMDVI